MARPASPANYMVQCPKCKDQTVEVGHQIWEITDIYLEIKSNCILCKHVWYLVYFPEGQVNDSEDSISGGTA